MKKIFALAAIIFLLGSCSATKEYVDAFKSTGVSGEYLSMLERYTVKKALYSQLETRLLIAATYKSKEFRDAYNKEYSRLYELSNAEIKAKENIQKDLISDFSEYFFYAYVAERSANDFHAPNSLWKVYLLNEKGDKIEPLEIRKVENVTPLTEQLFPYINRYHGICYLLKFPAGSGPDAPGASAAKKLVVTGVLGKTELNWQ